MNENIDLTKILKDCPKGWEFYSDICGKVVFDHIDNMNSKIIVVFNNYINIKFTKEGYCCTDDIGEKCILFPSKDQRDWSAFISPWYNNKERFNPKTLKPFDKVLVRDNVNVNWNCDFLSHIIDFEHYPYKCIGSGYVYCIPYNDDTKHLVGTKEEAPEYYRYWED